MTPFNIAFLFCRLLSIWCVVRFVEAFGQLAAPFLSTFIFSSSINGFITQKQLSNLGVALGMCFLACVLWLGAPIIARNVAQNLEYPNENEFRHTKQNWWNIGRGLLGLYFLVTGITGFFATVFNFAGLRYGGKTMALSFGSLQNLQLFYFMPAVSSVMTAIAGVWLLLVARRDSKREVDSTTFQDANESSSL